MRRNPWSGYFSTFQLFLLTLFSALIVVAKIALRTPFQLPGHTGIFWMAIMIVAGRAVPKRGATSLVGVTSGIIAAFLGVGDMGAINTLLSYSAIGIGVDLCMLLLPNLENIPQAVLVGAIGHLAKLLVKWMLGIIMQVPLGFVALGLARSIVGYILFGAIGGLLGALTLLALRKAGYFAFLAEKK